MSGRYASARMDAELADKVAPSPERPTGIGYATAKIGRKSLRRDLFDHGTDPRAGGGTTRYGHARRGIRRRPVRPRTGARDGRRGGEAFGRVDVLVNNAGMVHVGMDGQPGGPFLDLSDTDWDLDLRLNLDTAYAVTRAAVPGMVHRGWGRVVMVSSVTGSIATNAGSAGYAAAKAGMDGLMRTVALEVGHAGVTVNSWPPAGSRRVRNSRSGRRRGTHPIGRSGTPEEVAEVLGLAWRARAREDRAHGRGGRDQERDASGSGSGSSTVSTDGRTRTAASRPPRHRPPAPLAALLARRPTPRRSGSAGRPPGRYDPAHEVLLYGTVIASTGEAGDHVLTPLGPARRDRDRGRPRLGADRIDECRSPARPRRRPGPVRIVGVLFPPDALSTPIGGASPAVNVTKVDLGQLGAQVPYRLLPFYVLLQHQEPPQHGAPARAAATAPVHERAALLLRGAVVLVRGDRDRRLRCGAPARAGDTSRRAADSRRGRGLMGCLFVLVSLVTPRIVLFCMWIFTDYLATCLRELVLADPRLLLPADHHDRVRGRAERAVDRDRRDHGRGSRS